MKRRPLPYGFHYNIPTAFDPSVSYDMQYQRLREIVYSIIDNMEIHIPYMIFTTEAHTNDVVTLTGSFYTDHKEVLANKTFSLKGLPDGTYYININAKYKFEPCEPNCSCVKAISPDSDMTLETIYMPEGGITLYTVTRKNGEITAVDYNDIYTGMHNVDPEAHENRFSDVYAKIKAEVDRATEAETTLQHNIDNETARAMDAENVLDEKIKTEQNRATAAEHTLQDNIDKEQARAEQAEATLQANITAEKNRATTAEDGLQKAIDAERTRAVAAENNLQKNIDNEVTNRTAADTAERERAVNAENELAGDIASESADRQRADTALDTKLTGLIQAEETRATQAEGNLKTAIDTEETARINADNKEINDRTAADTALGKRIDTEVSNRTAADTAERDRAVAAEENLQSQINSVAEVGPGHKQNIFCKVTAEQITDTIYKLRLNEFGFWDKEKNKYIPLEGPLVLDTPSSTTVNANEIVLTGRNITFNASSGAISVSNGSTGKAKILNLEDGTNPNEAVNKKQLDAVNDIAEEASGYAESAHGLAELAITEASAKQPKITLGDTIAMDQVSVNSVIVRGEDGAGFISRDNGAIKVSDGDSTTPIEIINVKASSNKNAAATFGQINNLDSNLNAKIADVSSTANTAKSTAETALAQAQSAQNLAATAQNDINLIKSQVDNEVTTLDASIVTGNTNVTSVNAVDLKKFKVANKIYIISGFIDLSIDNQTGVSSIIIDLGNPTIVSTLIGKKGGSKTQLNNYIKNETNKLQLQFWGEGNSTGGTQLIAVTITAIFE